MRRAIELVGAGSVLELSRVTRLHIHKQLFHLDLLTDGTWRITFTGTLLPKDHLLRGVALSVQGRAGTAHLEYEDLPALEMRIARVAPIASQPGKDLPAPQMLHLDQADDGTWKLLYSRNLIPDVSKLSRLQFIRED